MKSSLFQSRPTRKKHTLLFNTYCTLLKWCLNTCKFSNSILLHFLLYQNSTSTFIYYTFTRLFSSFYSKSCFLSSIWILTYFYTKNVILSFVIFRMISMSQKKKKYIIYWLSITYILTFIFFVSNFWKNDKWQMTFC